VTAKTISPKRLWLVLFLVFILTPVVAWCDDIRLLGDWTYSLYNSETTEAQSKENLESKRFTQRYRLDVNKEIFPMLNFNGGAQMEKNDLRNELDDGLTRTKDRTEDTVVRPYFELELRTPIYALAGGYEERAVKTTTSSIGTRREYDKTYTGRFEWRPEELPSFDVNYIQSSRHDEPQTRKSDTQVFRLTSKYEYEEYEFLYTFLRSEEKTHLFDMESLNSGLSDTLTNTHNGRVRYNNTFWDDRLSINASARLELSTLEFLASNFYTVRTEPSGSSFYLLNDDDPTNDEFDTYVSPLIPIEIGKSSQNNSVTVGLDFGEDVSVDQLQISIQANQTTLERLNSQSFSWAVYSSDDRLDWVQAANPSVYYDPFNARVELTLASRIRAPYIKVVTTPLPISSNIDGSIQITDIRSYVVLAVDRGSKYTSSYRNATFDAAWDATDQTKVLFNTSYQYRETDLFDDQSTRWSNSIGLIHRFNPIFTSTTRLLRTDTWEQGAHDSSTNNLSAQLVGRYLETLSQTLTYSGGQSHSPDGDSTYNSIILRTNAALYTGWDVSFDQGYSWQSPVEGEDTSSFFVRIENSIVPHRRFTLLADYSIRWNQTENEPSDRTESTRLRTYWVPIDTLNFIGEIRTRKSEGDTYVYWEYGANWLPFRDGTLQFNLNYSEKGDNEDDLTRTVSSSLVWSITRTSILTLLYTKGTQEEGDQKTDFDSAQINLRILYD